MEKQEKISSIIKHIKRVENNCNTLSQKLFSCNELFAIELIQRGRQHDVDKFTPFLLENLWSKSDLFSKALDIHRSNNSHHPEFYPNGIKDMSELDLAEMVCDCLARGQEFGTDTRKWFEDVATKKYNFEMSDTIGQSISYYLDLLLSPKFS